MTPRQEARLLLNRRVEHLLFQSPRGALNGCPEIEIAGAPARVILNGGKPGE